MSQENCILTTKDFTILEVMRERCLDAEDPMRPLLDRKLACAQIIFSQDAPATLATLSSRVSYTVNSGEPDARILSHGPMNSPTGLYLPITTLRGLALLGLTEGQEFRFVNRSGNSERILLQTVQFQPEAARRERETTERLATPEQRRLGFRVIGGQKAQSPLKGVGTFDDPGPSAA